MMLISFKIDRSGNHIPGAYEGGRSVPETPLLKKPNERDFVST